MSREKILAKVESLPSVPKVFEALWGGDSRGYSIGLSVLTADGQSHWLADISEGGDIRLFNGQVPPWPEAAAAQQLGQELAQQYNAEFYFPSPNHPEEDCPDWKNRDKGVPCRRCGIPLLLSPKCPWQGICYFCHLDEEREGRETKWTPEERSGPRCHICGKPATGELNGSLACADCLNKYEVYKCEKCGVVGMVIKSIGHTSLCPDCELQITIAAFTEAQRNTIRDAMAKGMFEGLDAAIEVMVCSLSQAQSVLHMLGNPNTTDNPT